MKFLTKLAAISIATILGAYLLPCVTFDESIGTVIILALVLGLLNTLLRPILVFFTIPITIITLGLFLLVINAGIILMASNLVDGFSVNGFWCAIGFSLILSFIGMIFKSFNKKQKKKKHA